MLARLRAECAFDDLSPRDQGKLYAARVEGRQAAVWLHRARKGRLDTESLRKHFASPTAAMEYLESLGEE